MTTLPLGRVRDLKPLRPKKGSCNIEPNRRISPYELLSGPSSSHATERSHKLLSTTGFGTDGFVMVVFLCVGDRFLWMLLCAVEAYGSSSDADLASYYKVAVVWNLGRYCPFLVSVIVGRRSGSFAYQLAEKPGWNLCPTFVTPGF